MATLVAFAGAHPVRADWDLKTYSYGNITAAPATAQILSSNTNYNPTDTAAPTTSAMGTSSMSWKWEPTQNQSATPPYTYGSVTHSVNLTHSLTTSVTPTPGNPGPTSATAKFTLGLYDFPAGQPTEQWPYSKNSTYNYYIGQVVTSTDPSTIPNSETMSRSFNVQEVENEEGPITYWIRAEFKFQLLNEAYVSTTSRGMNANGFVQGGSGSATSGDTTAIGNGQLLVPH